MHLMLQTEIWFWHVLWTFSGQRVNGGRGDVIFRIKDNDVVVTKLDGTFVTILKDGVFNNTSVKNALKENP